MADLKEIAENLINGKAPEVKELVEKALDEGVGVEKMLLFIEQLVLALWIKALQRK